MTVHTGPRGHGRSHLPFESPPPASVPRTHGRSHVQHTCVRDHACAQEHVCVCGNTDGRPALLTQRRAQVRPPRWPRTARPAGPQSGPSGPRAAAVLREAGPLPSPPAVVIPPPRGRPGGRPVHAAPRSVGDARLRPPRTHVPPNRAAAARPAPPGSALPAEGRTRPGGLPRPCPAPPRLVCPSLGSSCTLSQSTVWGRVSTPLSRFGEIQPPPGKPAPATSLEKPGPQTRPAGTCAAHAPQMGHGAESRYSTVSS